MNIIIFYRDINVRHTYINIYTNEYQKLLLKYVIKIHKKTISKFQIR